MIWFLIILFIILFLALIFLILRLKAHENEIKTAPAPKVATKVQEEKIPTIDNLLDIVSNPASSKDVLFGACRIFIEKLSIPPKQDEKISNEAKKYLNFISLVASHKNVDAKLVLFLGTSSKKKNPTYEREIEASEIDGINKRK